MRHFRHLLQACGGRLRLSKRGGKYLDAVGIGVRVLAEIEIGRIDFRAGIAQVDRIEVELQPVEKRQAGDDYQRRADDDGDPVALEEFVERGQEREAERLGLAGRVEETDQGGQQRDTRDEREQHAEAGDETEFRYATVIGRQERQEAGGGGAWRRGSAVRRRTGPPRERARKVVELMTLGPVAHAELDAEVDADADEQDGEIDRDQVERADHHQAEARRSGRDRRRD